MKKRYNFFYYIILGMITLLCIMPIAWGIVLSITPEFAMFGAGEGFFPSEITLENYYRLLTSGKSDSALFQQAMLNSVKLAVYTITIAVPLCILSAYTLTKFEFRGRDFIKNSLIFTMAIPVFMTITPLYKIFASFKLLNNLFWISIVYVTSFLPLGTWLLSIHFENIPNEIEEAGFIDGAGHLQVFFHIILPLSRTMIFSLFLILFIMAWNQFQVPLILASTQLSKPLSIAVSEFVSKDSVRYGITAASGILAILPPVLLAVLFKKYIILGISGGDME